MTQRIVVGISGASGAIYGIRMLELLRAIPEIETHLILSEAAQLTIEQETDWQIEHVLSLADASYRPGEIGAPIASGSFDSRGMAIAPCSIKTLAAVAQSFSSDLLARTADVHLKEGRPLLLMVRETPLHLGHLRLMTQAVEMGAIIMPPVPNWYARPKTTDDIINHTVGRALLRLGIENDSYHRWHGLETP